jgi:exosortase C (VPDSG-CTERM-specific)
MPADEISNLTNARGIMAEGSPGRTGATAANSFRWPGRFVLATAALVLCFSLPLYRLFWFAAHSKLHSYILLVPFVSVYLVWLKKHSLRSDGQPARSWAAGSFLGGAATLGFWITLRTGGGLIEGDSLALTTLSFLLCFLGVCCCFLGKENLRVVAFPIGFLMFMLPLPVAMNNMVETFLQHGSAVVAYGLFKVSDMPVFWQGLRFQLPGFALEVAPECSGIHSSTVLLLTSLLAGHLFLRTPWKRAALVLAVIPLALLRNGLRVFIIGQLCVNIGPEMIRSSFHRHGGALFFVLSLIPLFLLLLALRKSERLGATTTPKHSGL